jgi:acyl-coenzyme A thioesterase PaaI-like protein
MYQPFALLPADQREQMLAGFETQFGPEGGLPPSFTVMQGDFLEFDPEARRMQVRFPVLETWLNPYGAMQGGFVAAAIDNVIGPLGVLLAPPNVTRTLELKYSRPVTMDMGFIIVTARLAERADPWLIFKVEVHDPDGNRLVRATGKQWILPDAE